MAGVVESVFDGVLSLVFAIVPCCAVAAVPCFFIAVVVLIVYIASKRRKRYESVLSELALETGGEFRKGDISSTPTLGGEFKGRRFLIDTVARASNDSDGGAVYYMRVQLWHKGSLAGGISVYREAAFSGLGRALGMQDIKVGDGAFDSAFVVQGKDESEVKRFLNADVRQKFLEVRIPLYINSDRLIFERAGNISDKGEIVRVLDYLSYMAEQVEHK